MATDVKQPIAGYIGAAALCTAIKGSINRQADDFRKFAPPMISLYMGNRKCNGKIGNSQGDRYRRA